MMFRIMVVDDESFVTDWISHLLSEVYGEDVDVYRYNDATSALRQLLAGIYDIAILDISMPEVNGIDILRALQDQKIETQIIYLTAYSEFEYAKRAIAPQVVAYVLKGEPDEVLLDAINAAFERIRIHIETENLVKIAHERIKTTSTINIRREYFIRLLQGSIDPNQEETSISLLISPVRPVLLLICALNNDKDKNSDSELLLEISDHIEDYLSRFFLFEGVMPHNNRFVWLLQPKDNDYYKAFSELLTVIESAEMLFYRHTGDHLIFVYNGKPFAFADVACIYQQLLPLLHYGLGKGHIVLTEEDLPDVIAEKNLGDEKYHQLSRDTLILQNLIENGERNESLALLDRLLEDFDSAHHNNDPVLMEAFCFISGTFFSILNKTGGYLSMSKELSLLWLGNPYAFSSWEEAADAFRQLTNLLLNRNTRSRDSRSHICIDKTKDYIIQNLEQDLSLLLLAEKVFLNPSYLSILFKKKVGCNISDFIKAERLKKACQLLVESRMKINEIARLVGYPNATYFGKFFKQETGMTPLEYRNHYSIRKQIN